jgi:hypothetical protein
LPPDPFKFSFIYLKPKCLHFFSTAATLLGIGQFSALSTDFFRVDKKSGFFSVANLHATSPDPIEATKETFAKLNGKKHERGGSQKKSI